MAPLGPIRTIQTPVQRYYLDQMGNEYNSIEHILLCAVSKALACK